VNYAELCRKAIAGKPRNQFVPQIGSEPGRTPALVSLPAMVIRGLLASAPASETKTALQQSTRDFRDTEELILGVDDVAAVLDSIQEPSP
jgi:hypothetical protein